MQQSHDREKYGPQYGQTSRDLELEQRLERLEYEAYLRRQQHQQQQFQQLQQQNQTQYYYLPNGKTCSVLHGYVNCY
ncbi:MAG: hypothetical protein E8D42_07800 [Nitrospira sp.]|nr:MAG: hypothetical protein E8D42_07800 [Nitrospira sp.]